MVSAIGWKHEHMDYKYWLSDAFPPLPMLKVQRSDVSSLDAHTLTHTSTLYITSVIVEISDNAAAAVKMRLRSSPRNISSRC